MTRPQFTIESATGTQWRLLLEDGEVQRRLPRAGDELTPGQGPGDLHWIKHDDAGYPGLRASWAQGAFVILRPGRRDCVLFQESGRGDFTALCVGSVDALKRHAAARLPARDLPNLTTPLSECKTKPSKEAMMRAVFFAAGVRSRR